MKKLNIIFAFLFITQIVVSQTLYSGSDTTKITENSMQLIVHEHRGDVQWQYSTDSIQWLNMPSETNDTLLINPIDTSAHFRARIIEGNCLPVFTDLASLRYEIPVVTTLPIKNIAENSAIFSGEVTDEGGADVTSRGFYLSAIHEEPDMNDIALPIGDGIGSIEKIMNALQANTTYFIRAYAINKKGTAYGEVISFKTSLNLASVATYDITDIEQKTATFNGEVTDNGGKVIISRGFYWSPTDRTPDKNDLYIIVDGNEGSFSASIGNLQPNTTYYVSAFAETGSGTAIGNVKTFKTKETSNVEASTITYEGKTYKIVEIGTQWWMAENLAYLPSVSPVDTGSSTEPVYYVYNYNGTNVVSAKSTSHYNNYGVLYNWAAATTACPSGWHLPSDSDWEELAQFISNDNGGYSKDADGTWANVGKHLQATSGWFQTIGTDDYEFTALPGGYRGFGYEAATAGIKDFYGYYGMGGWWSSTSYNNENAWGRLLILNDKRLLRPYREKFSGTSVRCVKD